MFSFLRLPFSRSEKLSILSILSILSLPLFEDIYLSDGRVGRGAWKRSDE